MNTIKDMIQDKYIKNINGKTYYLVSAFLRASLGRERRITDLICRIPKEYIYYPIKRGRNSGCYSTKDGLIELIKTMPRFPLKIKEKLGIYIQTTGEQTFEYMLNGFCTTLGIILERQVFYYGYSIDFVINKNIAIEYNEYNHCCYDNIKNNKRDREIYNKFKYFFKFNHNDNAGELFAKIVNAIQNKKQ